MKKFFIILLILANLARPVLADEQAFCLAQNVYFEARGESKVGQYAVADVVLNRVLSDAYPTNICDVVKQKHQFSWFWDDKSDNPVWHSRAWYESYKVASTILHDQKFLGITNGATHYHANYVNPSWPRLHKISTFDKHIFYKRDI
jgi:spore germination cell wall hydrolase CwlJ-like protein